MEVFEDKSDAKSRATRRLARRDLDPGRVRGVSENKQCLECRLHGTPVQVGFRLFSCQTAGFKQCSTEAITAGPTRRPHEREQLAKVAILETDPGADRIEVFGGESADFRTEMDRAIHTQCVDHG